MAINTAISDSGDKLTISVFGKFDFQLFEEFKSCYAGTEGTGLQYVVDLSSTEYMDSSALGMLLLLREHAGGDDSKIEISRPSSEVKKVLDVANFDKLFNI